MMTTQVVECRRWERTIVILFGCCAGVLLVGCTNPGQAAQGMYDAAVTAQGAGRLADSDRLLDQLLTEFPETDTAESARSLLADVRAQSEDAALQVMGEIRRAQAAFMARERRYAQSADELVTLGNDADGSAIGYRIRVRGTPAADAYTINAEAVLGVGSRRSFFQDADGVIHWARDGAATADSPVLD